MIDLENSAEAFEFIKSGQYGDMVREHKAYVNSLMMQNIALQIKLFKIGRTLENWKARPTIESINRRYAIRCIEHDLGEIDDDDL